MSVEIIAEVATNHGGSLILARRFIHEFAPYVDTVKFQLTRVQHLRAGDPQRGWFDRSEFTIDQFGQLKAECERAGVGFLLTVYNAKDVWELIELGCSRAKIGSGEAQNSALRDAVLKAGLAPVVSLGLVPETHGRLPPVQYWGEARFLGCCTRYPAPQGLAAVAMTSGRVHGWSDHAVGLNELQAAIATGARLVETHVQLPDQARPPQPWEKTVDEMRQLREFATDNPAERFLGRWQS